MSGATTGQFMLEKTVSNTLRLPFLFKVFPEAKFIHLIRDGRSVVESVFRLWDQPTAFSYKLKKLRYFPVTNFAYAYWFFKNSFFSDKKARVWGTRYEGIYEDLEQHSRLLVCARQWVSCIESAERDFKLIDPSQVYNVRYESLVSDPDCINPLCEFLGLNDNSNVIQRYNETVRGDTRDKWRDKWTDDEKAMLSRELDSTLSRLNYGAVE